jgi:hypothetical protein
VSLRPLESLVKKKSGLKLIVALMKIMFSKLIEKLMYFAVSNFSKVIQYKHMFNVIQELFRCCRAILMSCKATICCYLFILII